MKYYEIFPHVGVGDLRFGISPSTAKVILGKPRFSDFNTDTGTTTQYWENNGLQLEFSKDDEKLISISMYSNINNIKIPGITFDWNTSKSTYSSLIKSDTSAMKTVGITVFFKYGIAVAGFLGEDSGDKSITAFSKGQWTPEDPCLEQIV